MLYICVSLANGDVDRCNQLAESGWEVHAIQWQSSTSEYLWDRSKERLFDYSTVVVDRKLGRSSAFLDVLKLLWLVIKIRPTVAVTYSYNRISFFLANIVMLLFCVQFRYSMHDSKMDDYQRYYYIDISKIIMTSVYSGFLVATERAAYYLRYLGKKNVALYRCCFQLTEFMSAQKNVSAEDRFNDGNFICIARFVKKKNHRLLLSAFEKYTLECAGEKKRRLILCGYGPLEEELKDIVRNNVTLAQNVDFVSSVSRADIADMLSHSFCALLASYHEEFGISIVESLASGCPVIVSTNCGAADFVEDFYNGFKVDADNELGWWRYMRLIEQDFNVWSALSTNAVISSEAGSVSSYPIVIDSLIATNRGRRN